MHKVFIIAPNSLEKMADLVLFVEAIRFHFEDSLELHMAGAPELIESFKVIDKKIYTHDLPPEMNSPIRAHKFAYNLKDVFNIDVIFDFESSLKSSVICLTLRPGMKVGATKGVGRIFYDFKMPEVWGDERSILELLNFFAPSFNRDQFLESFSSQTEKLSEEALFDDVVAPWRVIILRHKGDNQQQLAEALAKLAVYDEDSEYLLAYNNDDVNVEALAKGDNLICGPIDNSSVNKALQHAEMIITDCLVTARYFSLHGIHTCFLDAKKRSQKKYYAQIRFDIIGENITWQEFIFTDSKTKQLKSNEYLIDSFNSFLERPNIRL